MLKYVRLNHPVNGTSFVFSLPPITHAALAAAHVDQGQPVSAGFVHFGPACGIIASGSSDSLKLATKEDDARYISALYAATSAQQNATPTAV